MIRIKIVTNQIGKNIKEFSHTFRDNGQDAGEINAYVYDVLTRQGIDEVLAIDCACWCELAEINESYNEDEFDVYIEEE